MADASIEITPVVDPRISEIVVELLRPVLGYVFVPARASVMPHIWHLNLKVANGAMLQCMWCHFWVNLKVCAVFRISSFCSLKKFHSFIRSSSHYFSLSFFVFPFIYPDPSLPPSLRLSIPSFLYSFLPSLDLSDLYVSVTLVKFSDTSYHHFPRGDMLTGGDYFKPI